MPELPEVEVIRRDLLKEVVGRTIDRAEVRDVPNAPRVIRRHAAPPEFTGPLAGRTINRLERRGKYLLFHLNDHLVLVVHLGMSGQLILSSEDQPFARHTHAVLHFAGGGQLRYVDPRTFGEMFVTEGSDLGEIPELVRLGRDPIAGELPLDYLTATFARRKTRMKPLLMDQTFICGLGNIYSDEVLFLSGIRHDRPAPAVTERETRLLHQTIPMVLAESIESRGSSIADEQYRDLYGEVGSYQNRLRVYGREAQPCLRCGTPIERARWSNRSTFYCPRCQS
ncbi:MAG TPA: bifunctional DNA-formamidopyrimidine glycosylase/DNA-(apurinic or apyrimidinic site) lyase [Actinomycetota bacterium]|nr:bifunctional DNA-formamidopyrimidine glycosylase/DNA-(apurinic or apyrimidinic site) lyase [Actinomycetota bacterium]